MYYVAWIYVRDSTPWIGYQRLRRYRQALVYHTHGVLNLILLISRDAIHLVVVGTLIGLLPCYRLMIRNQLVYAGSIVALRMPPRVIYQRV